MPDPDCGSGGSLNPLVCPRCGKPSQKARCALTPCGAYLCIECFGETVQYRETRRDVPEKDLERAKALVCVKLAEQLSRKGYGRFVSPHEAYGVLKEEVLELEDALRENDIHAFRGELADIAVAAIFALAGFSDDAGRVL